MMTAPDQLRHRMAWALSQIFIVGMGGLGNGYAEEIGIWATYYDVSRPFNLPYLFNYRSSSLQLTL